MTTVVFKTPCAKRVVSHSHSAGVFNIKHYDGNQFNIDLGFTTLKTKNKLVALILTQRLLAISSGKGHMCEFSGTNSQGVKFTYIVVDLNNMDAHHSMFVNNARPLCDYDVIELSTSTVNDAQYILFNSTQFNMYVNSSKGLVGVMNLVPSGSTKGLVVIPSSNVVDVKPMSNVHCGDETNIMKFNPLMTEA